MSLCMVEPECRALWLPALEQVAGAGPHDRSASVLIEHPDAQCPDKDAHKAERSLLQNEWICGLQLNSMAPHKVS